MKTVNKIKDKKHKTAKKPKIKSKKEKILVVAQEIKFARLLSGNDKKTRDRVLKSFKKWLLTCFDKGHEFKEDDFIRVWKGLFYAVWMSDKPLIQEDLCETIAGILDLFPKEQIKYALMMTKAGFKVLATEWYGIDHHRMDKFLMLARRYLRGSLRCLQRCKWKTNKCKNYADMLAGSDGILALKTPLYARNAGSLLLHFVDCFLEELAKVSEGNLPPEAVVELLRPFCSYMVHGESPAVCVATRRLLTALLRQTDQGLEYRERTKAWEQMGCPRGGPDALELESDDETNGFEEYEEEETNGTSKALDPRAGRVDVVLHSIPVPADSLAKVLKGLLSTASSKAHKRTKICLQRFEQLAKDEYPLIVSDVRAEPEARPKPSEAAKALRALEKKLVASSDELALRGLSRKHRKRLLAKSRAGLSIVDDVPQAHITSTNGDWAVVESAKPKETDKKTNKQKSKDASDKENIHKGKKAEKRKTPDSKTDGNNKKLKKPDAPTQNGVKAKPASKINNKTLENVETLTQKIDKHVERLKKNLKDNKVPQLVTPQKPINKTDKPISKPENNKIKNELVTPQKSFGKHKNLDSNKKGLLAKSDKNKILNGRVQKKHEENVKKAFDSPKKVKFVLKNNSMQGTMDYYKSIRQSPSIPFDSSKKPSKTNLKVSTPSPINPFFKKKLRLK